MINHSPLIKQNIFKIQKGDKVLVKRLENKTHKYETRYMESGCLNFKNNTCFDL